MIIDAHCHLGALENLNALGASGLRDELQMRGVEKSVVFTVEGFSRDPVKYNDHLAAQTAPYREFFFPWATVHPVRQGPEAAAAELRRCVRDLGMTGLKFHSWLQGFSVSSPTMMPIIEEAVSLGIPITFHDGTPPYASPLQIANLARLFPRATIILAHCGLREMWRDALLAAEELENVWLGIPGPPLAAIQQVVDRLGPDRIIYGSDGGVGHPSAISYALKIVDQLRITDDARDKILGGNTARLLEAGNRGKKGTISGRPPEKGPEGTAL